MKNLTILITMLLVSLPIAPAYADLMSSAVRLWTFDNTLQDSKAGVGGSMFNGQAATFRQDRGGNTDSALNFDGTDDGFFVDNTSDLLASSNFSISFWFTIDSFEHSRTYLLDNRGPGITGSASSVYIDDSSFGKELYPLSGKVLIDPNIDLTDGWFHFLASNDGENSRYRAYLNGNLVRSSGSLGIKNFNGGLTFGTYGGVNSGETNYWLEGAMDEVAIFDKPLTGKDAKAIFKTAPGEEVPLNEPTHLMSFAIVLFALYFRRLSSTKSKANLA